MKHPHGLAELAAELLWCHLARVRTLAAPVGLMLGATIDCLLAHRAALREMPGVLMLPGDLGPAGHGQIALLLFWILTYGSLPFQVFGLHDMALRRRLVERLRSLTGADCPAARHSLRLAAGGLAAIALAGIAQVLFGTAPWSSRLQPTGGLLYFLVVNWALLHLLMGLATLATSLFAASRSGTPAHRAHPDSRHAPG